MKTLVRNKARRLFLVATALAASTITASATVLEVEIGDLKYHLGSYEKTAGIIECLNKDIESLHIPSSITHEGVSYWVYGIDDADRVGGVFRNCTKLTNISWGDAIRTVVKDSFAGCTSLKYVQFPNRTPDRWGDTFWVGVGAFNGCTGLEKIYLPVDGVAFGDTVFARCVNLKKVLVPNSDAWFRSKFKTGNPLTDGAKLYIGYGIGSPEEQITDIVMPREIKIINENQFRGYSDLHSIKIADDVKEIGGFAFDGCSGLGGTLEIPSSVSIIRSYAFARTSLTEMDIPSTVTNLGSCVFEECRELKRASLPPGKVPAGTFRWCTALESVNIGDTLNSGNVIYNSAFEYCRSLKDIKIPYGITEIWDYAFIGCSSLDAVVIPSSCSWIREAAFAQCSSLKEVEIPNSVIGFHGSVFHRCESLEEVTIPASCGTGVTDYMFKECTALKEVTIMNPKEASVGRAAFQNCDNLKVIKVAGGPGNIYDDSFDNYDKTLYVPIGKVEKFRQASIWKNFFDIREWDPITGDVVTEMDQVDTPSSEVTVRAGYIDASGLAPSVNIGIYTVQGQEIYVGRPRCVAVEQGVYVVRVADKAHTVRVP